MKNLWVAALFLILSSAAVAGTSFCVTALGDTLQTVDSSSGCEADNMIFTMFQASGGTGVGTSFNPGLSGLELVEVSTSLPLVNTTPPVLENTSIAVSPTGGTAWGSGTGTGSSNFGYLASLDPAFTPQPNPPYSNWVLSNISLGLVQDISGNFQAGDSLTVTENFCLGGSGALPVTPLTCSGAGQVLGSVSVTATATSNSTFTYLDTCSFGGGSCSGINNNTVTLALPLSAQIYQTLTVQDVITGSSVAGSITVPDILNNFDEAGVDAVPESSTFVMIGSAMIAIGCLRHRRVRQRLLNRSIDS